MVQSTNSIAVNSTSCLKLIQTSVMYVLECTCLYCDENHVVLLGILSNVSSKAQENNVHQKKCANNIILLSALAVPIYFWFSK